MAAYSWNLFILRIGHNLGVSVRYERRSEASENYRFNRKTHRQFVLELNLHPEIKKEIASIVGMSQFL